MFIHYGAERFNPNAVRPVTNVPTRGIKPTGGFWACPTNAHWSWERFLRGEQYNLESLRSAFQFNLHPETKLLTVNSMSDLAEWSTHTACEWSVDWEGVFTKYDALLLTDEGLESLTSCDPEFPLHGRRYGVRPFWHEWDAATLLVNNPEVVVY